MKKIKSIFTDKASLLVRKMLQNPGKKWIISDFVKEGTSPGWASEILTEMSNEGYIERISRGPLSYSILRYPDRLLIDWTKWYRFKFNTIYSFYSPLENIEEKLIHYFKKNNLTYALTLFSGAKRIAPYVDDLRVHIYIPSFKILGDLVRFREIFNLLELKESGAVHFVIPYYKDSVFKYLQCAKGATIVSSLQLYLDLYAFSPRGKEQAEYLLDSIKRKGHAIT